MLATTGLLVLSLGAQPDAQIEAQPSNSEIVPIVGLGWRAGRFAGRFGHGPDFRAGVRLWDHFFIGLSGFARSGPINPETFDVTPVDGQTYKGASTVSLRSDGSFIGLMLGASISLTDWLDIELPVSVGIGSFGFYLVGEDRDTPDGRRVSEWETELLDGRDASAGLGLDLTPRLSFHLDAVPWLRPYIGGYATWLIGYDAFFTDDYSGFGATAGLEIGLFK